jgi:hypothetical protein
LSREEVFGTLRRQYERLAAAAAERARLVLWFDACLFDQAMLVHILTCLAHQGFRRAELLCVERFPGIVPFHGLGQLEPAQLASLFDQRRPVTEEQFRFADVVDQAFAAQDAAAFAALARHTDAPLPRVPAAVTRWLEEQPDPATGLGRLEQLALGAIRGGCETPGEIYAAVSAAETPPQFWGDTTLWAKINGLAERRPPLARIEGPAPRLPQWPGRGDLQLFRVQGAGGRATRA